MNYIKLLLIRLGWMKAPSNGCQMIEETLAGFVSIVESLHEGAELITQEMEGNAAAINQLREKNMVLSATNSRAYRVRENLLKLMGE